MTVMLGTAFKIVQLRAQADLSDASTLVFIAACPYIIILSIAEILVGILVEIMADILVGILTEIPGWRFW